MGNPNLGIKGLISREKEQAAYGDIESPLLGAPEERVRVFNEVESGLSAVKDEFASTGFVPGNVNRIWEYFWRVVGKNCDRSKVGPDVQNLPLFPDNEANLKKALNRGLMPYYLPRIASWERALFEGENPLFPWIYNTRNFIGDIGYLLRDTPHLGWGYTQGFQVDLVGQRTFEQAEEELKREKASSVGLLDYLVIGNFLKLTQGHFPDVFSDVYTGDINGRKADRVILYQTPDTKGNPTFGTFNTAGQFTHTVGSYHSAFPNDVGLRSVRRIRTSSRRRDI